MQNAKTPQGKFMFGINEWLTASQIRSYFSRIRLTKSKQTSSVSHLKSSQFMDSFDNEDDDDEDAYFEVTLFFMILNLLVCFRNL